MILVVRHGSQSGRIPRYCDHVVRWLRAERPHLGNQIRIHETGSGPADLSDVQAVFFWLGDPLEILYPECFSESLGIETEADRWSLRVLNRPSVLARYGKFFHYRRLAAAGIDTPAVRRIGSAGDLQEAAQELGLPLLIRGDYSFGQKGTRIISNERQLASTDMELLPADPVASHLLDVRDRERSIGRDRVWSRYYHRKRVILVGGECAPYSLMFSRVPVVGQHVSEYERVYRWRRRLRPYGRPGKQAVSAVQRVIGLQSMLSCEKEFLDRPAEDPDLFRRASAALGLEYLAFDYATVPGEGTVIWEANPYPFLPAAGNTLLHHTRNQARNTERIYHAFASTFSDLLA